MAQIIEFYSFHQAGQKRVSRDASKASLRDITVTKNGKNRAKIIIIINQLYTGK